MASCPRGSNAGMALTSRCASQIITDRETGKSKGYCFATFGDERDAQDALATGTGK